MSQKSISLQTMLFFLLSSIFLCPTIHSFYPLDACLLYISGYISILPCRAKRVPIAHFTAVQHMGHMEQTQKKDRFYHPIHHSRLFQSLDLLKVGFKICHTGLFIRIILSVYWSKISLVWEDCNSILCGVCCKEVHSCTHIPCCSTACSQH